MAESSPLFPWSAYEYVPNKAAAIFFSAAFALSALFHLWQCYHYRCFKLTSLLPFTCALLTAGFATRTYTADHPLNGQVYTASALLIHMAPPIFQLANFFILGRLFYYVPYFAPMHPARMQLTFTSLAAVIELLTVMGIAFLSNPGLPEKSLRMGDYMAKASLVAQVVIVGLFCPLVGIFLYCCRNVSMVRNPRVARPAAALCASTTLLLARVAFRVAELFGRGDGPVRHEWYFYVFDAAPLLVNTALWNAWHPRRYLPEGTAKYLAQDGKTELQGPGWKDTRSLTETFLDPFAALTARGGHQKPFWEHNGYALKRRR